MNQVPRKERSAVVKWSLILGIAIVTNLFITYAVRVIYHEKEYTDFCPEKQVVEPITTKETCLAVGGQWMEPSITEPVPEGVLKPMAYCNENFTCQKEYEEWMSLYNRNFFIVFVISGLLLLGASVFISGAEAVSLGLSFAGVLALVIGSVRYWSDMNDLLRVVILGIALATLIFLAWKKFKD